MPQLSDEYNELQQRMIAIELEKKTLTQSLQRLIEDEKFIKKRMQELKDEIEGRVQLSIFDNEKEV